MRNARPFAESFSDTMPQLRGNAAQGNGRRMRKPSKLPSLDLNPPQSLLQRLARALGVGR